MEKPEITYPCRWPYRVIGSNEKQMRAMIIEVLGTRRYVLGEGNSSRQGTYHSVHVEVTVADEEERNEIFRNLKAISGVRMVF